MPEIKRVIVNLDPLEFREVEKGPCRWCDSITRGCEESKQVKYQCREYGPMNAYTDCPQEVYLGTSKQGNMGRRKK